MRKANAFNLYMILSTGNALLFELVFTINMVYQVTVVGLDALQLVLVGTMLELTIFVFEVPTGVVADLYSRRLSIIIGTALIGVGFLVEGAFQTFGTVLLAQFLWGLGYTFTSGATQAWIVDEIGDEHIGTLFIRAAQVGKVGSIIGIVLSVALAMWALNLPIVVAGGLFILLALLLALTMPETGFRPVPRAERATWRDLWQTFGAGVREIRTRSVLLMIAGIGLFYGLYSEGFDRLWTPHLLDNIGLPTLGGLDPVVWFGMINLAGLVIGIVIDEVVSRRVDVANQRVLRRVLLLVNGLLVGTLAGFALAVTFPAALALLLSFNLLRGTTGPLVSTWMNRYILSAVRATVLSSYGQIDAFGQIGGGPVVGVIGQRLGVRAALLTSAAILTPVVLLLTRIRQDAAAEVDPAADG